MTKKRNKHTRRPEDCERVFTLQIHKQNKGRQQVQQRNTARLISKSHPRLVALLRLEELR